MSMTITGLTIETASSYSPNAGQLMGKVTLEGASGRQEIALSAQALSLLFGVVAAEIIETARRNAAMAKASVEEAISRPLLSGSATFAIEGEIL